MSVNEGTKVTISGREFNSRRLHQICYNGKHEMKRTDFWVKCDETTNAESKDGEVRAEIEFRPGSLPTTVLARLIAAGLVIEEKDET